MSAWLSEWRPAIILYQCVFFSVSNHLKICLFANWTNLWLKFYVCLKQKCVHMSCCMLLKYDPCLFVGKYRCIFVYEYERHVYMIVCKDVWMSVCIAWMCCFCPHSLFCLNVYIFVLKVWSECKLVCVFKLGSISKVSRKIKSKSLHVCKHFSYNLLQF